MKAVIPLVDIGGRHELSSPWNTASCTARCWGLGGSLSPVVCPLVGPISLHCCQRSVQEHLDCTRLRATGSHFRRLMLTQWKPMETSGWGGQSCSSHSATAELLPLVYLPPSLLLLPLRHYPTEWLSFCF